MSVPCLGTTEEAKENQETITEEKDKDNNLSELPEKDSISSDEVSKNEKVCPKPSLGKRKMLTDTPTKVAKQRLDLEPEKSSLSDNEEEKHKVNETTTVEKSKYDEEVLNEDSQSSKEAPKSKEVSTKHSNKRRLSPVPQSKQAKYSAQDDTSHNSGSTSDLSAGSTNERKDSSTSGSKATVDNTTLVAEHYNALEEKGLSFRNQSRIVYMRNFNNWIKSMLINEYVDKIKENSYYGSSLTILDMCCGKGGDLLKWKKTNVTHLICVDIAQVSVEQCQHRYNDILRRRDDRNFSPVFEAEFITADCTKVHLRERYKDPSIQFDLVSCQFAFHYSFETVEQAECMLRNASENLKPGGYFIGTMPDAYDLVSRWQKTEGNKFGNDVYSVEFLSEDKTKPPLFGAKYNFHLEGVVDCPEFLVYLPTLCKLASKFDLELVMSERFDDYYERVKDKGKSLLNTMKALETYSPYYEASLLGNPSKDYQYVQQYLREFPGNRKIRTLSESEWEVISLYIVFAFRKIKHPK